MRMDESLWGCPRRSRHKTALGAAALWIACGEGGSEGWHPPVSWRLWPALQVSGRGGSKLMITLALIHNNARSRAQQPQASQQRIDLLRLGRRSGPRRDAIEERLLGRAAGEDLVDDDGPLATEAARAAYDLLFVS